MRTLLTQRLANQARVAAARSQTADLALYVRPDGGMVPSVATAMFKANAELASALAAVTSDTLAISALEEDARQAGVPPGWLRILP